MTTRAVITIIANNYAAYASALMSSVELYEPLADRFVLIVDSPARDIANANVISPEDVGVNDSVNECLRTIYDVMEYCTALKAFALLHLLTSYDEVIFLDPDVVLFAALSSRPMWNEDWTVALTPHRITPPPMDGLMPDEELIKRYGVYNLGFIAVRRGGEGLLEWWNERLMWWSLKSPSSSLYTDQRWMDLAPSYFDVSIVRDPTLNLAPWNVDERDLNAIDASWYVGDEPLTFAHFSGIRSTTSAFNQDVMGPYARLKSMPERAQEFLKLCEWYRRELRSHERPGASPYSFARDSRGRLITPAARRRWRKKRYLSASSVQVLKQRRLSLPPALTESHSAEGLRSGFRSDLKRLRTSPKADTIRRKLLKVPGVRRILFWPTRWNAL